MKQKVIYSIIFTVCCFLKFTAAKAQINIKDSLALVDLYNSTDGPGWYNHTNWLTKMPIASWFGVEVENNRVTNITLAYNRLNGIIPESIGNLTDLSFLSLWDNQLTGNIPFSFHKLTNLQICALEYNELSGDISAFGKLVNLLSLELDGNRFTGNISSLKRLTKMIYLSLTANQLTGGISFLNSFSGIHYIALSSNQLSGKIPVLNNIDSIAYLNLGSNQFTGKIPAFHKSDALTYLNLSYNALSGRINHQFDSLSSPNLSIIITNNQLSGKLPALKLPNLEGLDLSYNQLTGKIPDLSYLKNLHYLRLSNNQLIGNIPDSLGKIKSLQLIDLSANQLTGTVPPYLTNLTDLYELRIDSNKFTFAGMENIAKAFSFVQYSPQAPVHVNKNGNILSVSAGGTLTNSTYKWYKNGQVFKTITGDSTLYVTKSAAYYVEVTNSVATALTLHSDTVDYAVGSNISAAQLNSQSKASLSVYPNPARTTATVSFMGNGKYVITISDVSGKILDKNTGVALKGINAVQLNVGRYANGLYLITITDEQNQKQTLKLNKE